MKTCIVVPHFDHLQQFRRFLPGLAAVGLPLIVVDDASPPDVFSALEDLLQQSDVDAVLVRHSENLGKGGAVTTGLHRAHDEGFTHALQVDADGQHDVADVDTFMQAAIKHPDAVICGEPVFDQSVSKLRYYARFITLGFSHLETLSRDIRDALCGFRLYPLKSITAILKRHRLGERMAFDPELLVRAVWAEIPLHYVPVNVVYPEDGRSHFHYLRDNVEISWMHTRLLFGMLLRSPVLLARKFRRRPGVAAG